MGKPNELTKAEWKVIKAVWEHEPCTAPEVQGKLSKQTGWAYSTVRTLMDRMVAKGILSSEKVRKATLYRSVITRAQAQRSEALYALKQAFNGALTPMVQCLIDSRNVSADELAQLEALVQAKKKTRKAETI
jgi:BlaI family transcriptional regulator, penicillinase repressor